VENTVEKLWKSRYFNVGKAVEIRVDLIAFSKNLYSTEIPHSKAYAKALKNIGLSENSTFSTAPTTTIATNNKLFIYLGLSPEEKRNEGK
jgi:hypothetical protein